MIHGGVSREERAQVVERFMQDKDMLVLIANDAAGEGVNLQRGYPLMVNYDLPWNLNKIEQRFVASTPPARWRPATSGIVAADTREGEAYRGCWRNWKLRARRWAAVSMTCSANCSDGVALKDLLFEAIQYGEQEDVKARLFQQVDGAVDQAHLPNCCAAAP